MEYDSILELVKARRSIRRFKSDPIPDDCINKIIEVARQAPSGFNMQPWQFVIIKDMELRDKIVGLFPPPGELDAPNDFRTDEEVAAFAKKTQSWAKEQHKR